MNKRISSDKYVFYAMDFTSFEYADWNALCRGKKAFWSESRRLSDKQRFKQSLSLEVLFIRI